MNEVIIFLGVGFKRAQLIVKEKDVSRDGITLSLEVRASAV